MSRPEDPIVPGGARRRLDLALVDRGLAPTRARARDAIRRGHVTIDGTTTRRPSTVVLPSSVVLINDPASAYVSRGALKLIAGLDRFGYSPEGRRALDIGASTGGFTQVLLERGAEHVTALDVGHGQLHDTIADDPRVTGIEGLNVRALRSRHLSGPVHAVVADTSFISLRLALVPAIDLVESGAWGVFLVKPQFELGPDAIGKGGIVRDQTAAKTAASALASWLERDHGWSVDGIEPSPIAGGDGNREFLIGARRGSSVGS